MNKKLVAFVVGHEHWGKSHTLRALIKICGHNARRATIGGFDFFVRKTSNDDEPKKYREFMKHTPGPHLIAALCPKFEKLENSQTDKKLVDQTLRKLQRRGFTLIFWVIKHKCSNPTESICKHEISELCRYGKVKVFARIRTNPSQRAKKFRSFVSNNIRP